MPPPPPDANLRRFWRLRFIARCGCSREVEMRVWQVLTDRGLGTTELTWRQFGARLRCASCGATSPAIDLPGWVDDNRSFADAYYPPN